MPLCSAEFVWHGEGWYRVADLRRLPEWIHVSVRLPGLGDSVWCFDGTDVSLGEYWGDSGFQSYGASCDREGLNTETLHGITHWMDIAEPVPPENA
jgi:hypothetical protein